MNQYSFARIAAFLRCGCCALHFSERPVASTGNILRRFFALTRPSAGACACSCAEFVTALISGPVAASDFVIHLRDGGSWLGTTSESARRAIECGCCITHSEATSTLLASGSNITHLRLTIARLDAYYYSLLHDQLIEAIAPNVWGAELSSDSESDADAWEA